MNIYKAKDMLEVTGISRSLYDQWVFKEVVRPHKEAGGPGRPADFSFGNLVSVKVMLILRNLGVRLKPSARIGEIVRHTIDNDDINSILKLIINAENPEEVRLISKGDSFKTDWAISLTIDLDLLRKDVKSKLG